MVTYRIALPATRQLVQPYRDFGQGAELHRGGGHPAWLGPICRVDGDAGMGQLLLHVRARMRGLVTQLPPQTGEKRGGLLAVASPGPGVNGCH